MDWPTINAARNYLWVELEGCEYAIKPPNYGTQQLRAEPQGAGPVQDTEGAATGGSAKLLAASQCARSGFDADAFARQMRSAAERQNRDTLNALGEQLRDVLDEETRTDLAALHQQLQAGLRDGQATVEPPPPVPAAQPRRGARAHAQ